MAQPTFTNSELAPEAGAIKGLTAFPSKGKPKGERLQNAGSLQSIYQRFKQLDTISAGQRAGVRAMLDGQPPYKTSSIRKSASANRSNLNFGEGKALLQRILTSYNDLTEGIPALVSVDLPVGILDDATKRLHEDIIARELTTMFKDWEDFDSIMQLTAKEFVEHGVSLTYFPTTDDWKWDAAGWDRFLLPRGTRASEKFVDMILIEQEMLPSELYRNIKEEPEAKEAGWDVEATRKALVRATRYGRKPMPPSWGAQWERVQQSLKNNDLFVNHEDNTRVSLIHAYIREYDGTFSHYIIERDAVPKGEIGDQAFLYKRVADADSPTNLFTVFVLNIGNGTYHSIRGVGYDMYPFVQVSNKARNGVIDNMMLSMKLLLQPKDVAALDNAPVTISGPLAILSPEVEYVERAFTNHTQATMPVLKDLEQMLGGITMGDAQSGGTPVSIQPQTKYGLQATQAANASLAVSSVNMFYAKLRRLYREAFRRVQKIAGNILAGDADEATEYPEVAAMLERCMRQNVDPSMILEVEAINERRAIGAGNPGQRQMLIDRGMQLLGTYDEVGRAQFLHDANVALFGIRDAQRYMPAAQKPRPVIDQKISELENAEMFKGTNQTVLEGENHAVHAQVHLPAIADSVKMLEDWRNNGEAQPIQELQPYIAFLSLLVPHTEQHVAALANDPTRTELYGRLRKALQEYAAIWMTYVRQLERALDEMDQEQQSQGQVDPVQQAKADKIRQDMALTMAAFKQAQQLKVADVQQKMMLRAKEADARIGTMIAAHNADMVREMDTPAAPASQSGIVSKNTRE